MGVAWACDVASEDFQHPAEDTTKQVFDELRPEFEGGTYFCLNNSKFNNNIVFKIWMTFSGAECDKFNCNRPLLGIQHLTKVKKPLLVKAR